MPTQTFWSVIVKGHRIGTVLATDETAARSEAASQYTISKEAFEALDADGRMQAANYLIVADTPFVVVDTKVQR